ncbi:MAG: hypothetical protein NTAFB01_13450 [Nitrospira sp.]
MRRKDLTASTGNSAMRSGAGTNYLVQTPTGVLYNVYISDANLDVLFRSSDDYGSTWSDPVQLFSGSATALSIWYDRWSNIAAGLIHVAYQESVTDDTLYRTIDTESSDALSTQTTIFLGASTATGGHLSITRAVGGNVYCKTVIDAGAEGGFFRLPNANVPSGAWDAARTVDEAIATTDQMILLPDYDAADTQDILAIFWDASANEISRKLYDDSANSWSETSIATSMADQVATTAFPHFAVAMDIANTQHILVAWSAVDTLNADLRCWIIDATTITEVTNVVQNSTDDQGLAAIALNTQTGWWHVFYTGKSDGSETFPTATNIYMKVSQDSGTTWSAETKLTGRVFNTQYLATTPRLILGPPIILFLSFSSVDANSVRVNVDLENPKARLQIGI